MEEAIIAPESILPGAQVLSGQEEHRTVAFVQQPGLLVLLRDGSFHVALGRALVDDLAGP